MIGQRTNSDAGIFVAVEFVDVAIPLGDRTWFLGWVTFWHECAVRWLIENDGKWR